MADYEKSLNELTAERSRAVAERARVEEEVRKYRAERLAATARKTRMLVLEAYARGASLAKIKAAYGTRDHATIANIINSGADEIAALQASSHAEAGPTWFTLTDDNTFVDIDWKGGQAQFSITLLEEDDDILLSTSAPRFDENGDENPCVAYFDGYTSDEVEEIEVIRKAMLQAGE